MKFGVGSLFLLIVEDFLLPVGAFSLGVKFTKRKVCWLSFFVFIGVLSRIIGDGDLYEIGLSVFILVAYYIGGFFYRETKSKFQFFVSLIFINIIILLIPSISVPLYSAIMAQKGSLLLEVSNFTGIKSTIALWIISGIEYWSYGLEVFEKLIIGFFVVRVYNHTVKDVDYSLDISYFHRRYGSIVLVSFMLVLLLKSLGYSGLFQYSIILFAMYMFFTGAIEIFGMGKLARVLKKGLLTQLLPYFWLGALVFVSFEVSFITIVATIIYSAYITTIGKHNIAKMLNDTIKRIKGV